MSRIRNLAVLYLKLLNSGTPQKHPAPTHSTVTDFARFLGLSTSVPRAQAV
jgi:hypothetical protein